MRRALWTLAVLGVFALGTSSTFAQGNEPFVFERGINTSETIDIARLVEQQSGEECSPYGGDQEGPTCVHNTHGATSGELCVWDLDDQWGWHGNGILPAGASASFTQCVIADHIQRVSGGLVHAKTPDLIVTMHFPIEGATFTFTARPSPTYDRLYEYRGCIVGPMYDGSEPEVVPIADSNGGEGVMGSVVVTVTNPTDRSSRTTSAQFLAGSNSPGPYRQTFCVGAKSDYFHLQNGAVWQKAL